MTGPVVEAINQQINSELSASYSYLAMSAWCERQKFTGAARWLRLQSQEEYLHAMKLLDFLLARDCEVQLSAIQAPHSPYASLLDVFELLAHKPVHMGLRPGALTPIMPTEP